MNPLRPPDVLGSPPSIGCAVCGISQHLVDTDARQGYVKGVISFGPALLSGNSTKKVTEYRLHMVDVGGARLGGVVAFVSGAAPPPSECCLDNFFSAHVQAALPPRSDRFSITPVVDGVELPMGTVTDSILDLVVPGGVAPAPLVATTTRLPASSSVRGVLSIYTPRGADLVGDAAAHLAIGESIAIKAQLPTYAVSIASIGPSSDRYRLEYNVAVLAGMATADVESRLRGVPLGDLEAEIAVRLALILKGSYEVRLIDFSVLSPTPPLAVPAMQAKPQETDAASSAGIVIGVLFMAGVAALGAGLCCLWKKLCKEQAHAERDRLYLATEHKDAEVIIPAVDVKGLGGSESSRRLRPPSPSPAIAGLDLEAHAPKAQVQAADAAGGPLRHPPPDEVDQVKPGRLLPEETDVAEEKKAVGSWVQEGSPGLTPIMPAPPGQVGVWDAELHPQPAAQRQGGVMGLLRSGAPQLPWSSGTRVAPAPEAAAEPGDDFGPNGSRRARVPRPRDPLGAGNIHSITTVNRGGRNQRDVYRPGRG